MSSFRPSFVEPWPMILMAGLCLALAADATPRNGEPVERVIAAGESQSWEIELEAGEFLDLVVEQHGIDVALELYDPEGALRTRLDSPVGNDEPEELFEVAPSSGIYRVEICPIKTDAKPGRYAVRPPLRRPATEADRLLVDADRLHRRAHALRGKKSFDEAIDAYRQALEIWPRLDQPKRQAESLQGLARAYDSKDDLSAAAESFEHALELAPAFGDPKLEAQLLQALARVLQRLGKVPEAIERFEQALALFERLGDERGTALTLAQLGTAYHGTGQIQRALDSFEQALELRPKLEKQLSAANVLAETVPLLLALDRPEEALERAQEALEIYRREGKPLEIAIGLKRVADVALRLGDSKLAERSIEESLELLPREALEDRWSALDAIGSLRLGQNDFPSARRFLTEALQLAEKTGQPAAMGAALVNLGHLERLAGQPQRALGLQDQAFEQFRTIKDPIGEATSRVRGAQALRDLGRFEEAWQRLQPALELVEELRSRPDQSAVRTRYFAFRQEYYEIAWDLLMRLDAAQPTVGYRTQAFLVNEQRLARELLDTLAESLDEPRAAVEPSLLERELAVEREIRRMTSPGSSPEKTPNDEKRLEELLLDLDRVRGEIRKTSPRHAALAPTRPVGIEQAQELLGDGSLLLVYALGAETSYLWALDRDALTAYRLPPGVQIETLARRFVARLRTPSRSSDRPREQDARALSMVLFSPVATRLGNRRLVVVAEGDLQQVPFAVLPDPTPEAGGEPLMLRHQTVTLPSISILEPLRREREKRDMLPPTIVAFADPVFSTTDSRLARREPATPNHEAGATRAWQAGRGVWPKDLERAATRFGFQTLERLEGSSEEARAILELAGGKGVLEIGFEASRDTLSHLEPGRFRVLHVATHGLLDQQHPELSGLVLSLFNREGQPQDGFVRAFEISRLDLPVDLVVLSACQTAVGLDVRGEGMSGLVRSFLHAGARRAIVSLWRVSDRATAELMKIFYRGYLKEGLAPSAALRQAQIALYQRPETASPYNWAAFVFEGDWQ